MSAPLRFSRALVAASNVSNVQRAPRKTMVAWLRIVTKIQKTQDTNDVLERDGDGVGWAGSGKYIRMDICYELQFIAH